MSFRAIILSAAALLITVPALAHEYTAGELQIGHPYARSTPPGARTAGAYLSIENKGKSAERLVKASSPAAGAVTLHSMSMDGEIMRMRAIPSIAVAPGAVVKLAPGGLHIMLEDIKRPLKKGDKIPMTLHFERAGEVKVELQIQDAAAASPPAAAKAEAHDHSGHTMKH